MDGICQDKKDLNGGADSSADGSGSDSSDGESSSEDEKEGDDKAQQQAAKKVRATTHAFSPLLLNVYGHRSFTSGIVGIS